MEVFRIANADSAANPLFAAAQNLETSFINEFLAHSGLGEISDSFGGGPGEEQFASFLRQELADELSRAGGFGLAQAIFDGLVRDGGGGHAG